MLASAKETIDNAKHWLTGGKYGQKSPYLPPHAHQISGQEGGCKLRGFFHFTPLISQNWNFSWRYSLCTGRSPTRFICGSMTSVLYHEKQVFPKSQFFLAFLHRVLKLNQEIANDFQGWIQEFYNVITFIAKIGYAC